MIEYLLIGYYIGVIVGWISLYLILRLLRKDKENSKGEKELNE